MPIAPDLFAQINNAVLDLQASQLQSYERPLKALGRLLKHSDLEKANRQLTSDLDLEAFLLESQKSQGSMVGSARLAWPDDPEKTLGLTLLLIFKFVEDPEEMIQFGFSYFYSGNKVISGVHAITRQLIIPFIRDYNSYVETFGEVRPKLNILNSKKVFIVHGHDGESREAVARFLLNLGLEPIILHEQASKGKTVIEKVETNGDVGFVVVLLTPDDEGCVKGGSLEPRARQNVLLELGYFIGRLGRDKVCALKKGDVVIPSDFAGVVWEAMDEGNGWKLSLARELRAARYQVDLNKLLG